MIVLDLQLVLFGVVLGLLGSIVGARWVIQQRKQSHTTVPHSAQQFLEELPLNIIMQQADGSIAFANRAARQLLATISPPAQQNLYQHLGDPTRASTAQSGMILQPQPLRWWRYPCTKQESLLVLLDNAEQQQWLRQQQLFIGQLSHELRTPLTALVAHTEIARSPQSSDQTRQTSLETIQRETQRMIRLVQDLLDLYRLETSDVLPLQPGNVVLVAEAAIAQIIMRAEEQGMNMTFEADLGLPRVLMHPDRLTQVFINLLDNAVKYCRSGDTIRVLLKVHPAGVYCAVADSGPGIALADLPRVTERLYRGHNDGEGTGMGLALVREILHRHHTQLCIESSSEGTSTGTTCSWVLPQA